MIRELISTNNNHRHVLQHPYALHVPQSIKPLIGLTFEQEHLNTRYYYRYFITLEANKQRANNMTTAARLLLIIYHTYTCIYIYISIVVKRKLSVNGHQTYIYIYIQFRFPSEIGYPTVYIYKSIHYSFLSLSLSQSQSLCHSFRESHHVAASRET